MLYQGVLYYLRLHGYILYVYIFHSYCPEEISLQKNEECHVIAKVS